MREFLHALVEAHVLGLEHRDHALATAFEDGANLEVRTELFQLGFVEQRGIHCFGGWASGVTAVFFFLTQVHASATVLSTMNTPPAAADQLAIAYKSAEF